MLRRKFIAATVYLLPGSMRAYAAKAPVEVRVPFLPTPFTGSDGRVHLGYEIQLANFHQDTGALEVTRLEVMSDGDVRPLATYEGPALADRIVHPGVHPTPSNPRLIPGGMTAVVYVWISLSAGQRPPRLLWHRIVFRNEAEAEFLVDGAIVEARSSRKLLAIGPPLRQGVWIAHEGPGNHQSHHWRSLLAANGRTTVPQRFAIDFIGLNDRGKAVPGEPDKSRNSDWAGYGADVLAVANGIVHSRHDGAPDNTPMVTPSSPKELTLTALYGNHVVLDAGDRQFIHYAHLQSGSVSVQAGQRVRRGQVIGRTGNSGNTNGAHLHFHISDSGSFEESEGLPFVFLRFETFGVARIGRAFGSEPGVPMESPTVVRNALPLDGAVVRFGTGRAK